MAGELQGKAVLITGAAGAIGRAVALRFAAEGASLGLCDSEAGRLNGFVQELRAGPGEPAAASGQKIFEAVVDVRESAQVADFVIRADELFGGIDILVNNAGVTAISRIDETTDAQIDTIIDTNLKGYLYFAREVVRVMKRRNRAGAILMISSKNGLEGASEKSVYSASKAGELAMARSLARELGRFHIRVNSICPDAVHRGSKLWERGGDYSRATARRYGISEEQIPEYYRKRCSLGINIQPEDVAYAALFLVSERSRATTGAVLTVDGGVAYAR